MRNKALKPVITFFTMRGKRERRLGHEGRRAKNETDTQ